MLRPASLLLPLLAMIVAGGPLPSAAQGSLTVDPKMARGPADAPVTIVEFSDYQ